MLFRVVHEDPNLTGVPARLADLITGCLAKDPTARPDLKVMMAALNAASSTQGHNGVRWLPEELTEVLVPPTLPLTRVKRRRKPPKPPPQRKTARLKETELVIGNLTLTPLKVLLDGAQVGAVSAGGRGRFTVEARKHTMQVDSGGRCSAVRRIRPKKNVIVQRAFNIDSGKNALPKAVEQVKFKEKANRALLLTGAILFVMLLGTLPILAMGKGEMFLISIPLLVGCLWAILAGVSTRKLVLRDNGLTFGKSTPKRKNSIRWNDLAQVRVLGEGQDAKLVVWPSEDLQLTPPLDDFQGGKVVCDGAKIGVEDHHDTARLRAALWWFADDLWAG